MYVRNRLNEGDVRWRNIMMKTRSVADFLSETFNSVLEPFQDFRVKMTVHCLSLCLKLWVDNGSFIEKSDEHVLHTLLCHTRFLWAQGSWREQHCLNRRTDPIWQHRTSCFRGQKSKSAKLKGHQFGALKAVKEATTKFSKEVHVDAFQGAFSDWEKRWHRCSDAERSYFEESYLLVHFSAINAEKTLWRFNLLLEHTLDIYFFQR